MPVHSESGNTSPWALAVQIYVYSDAGASAEDLQQVTSDIVVKKVADIIVTLSTALYAEAQGTCSGSIIAEIDVRLPSRHLHGISMIHVHLHWQACMCPGHAWLALLL